MGLGRSGALSRERPNGLRLSSESRPNMQRTVAIVDTLSRSGPINELRPNSNMLRPRRDMPHSHMTFPSGREKLSREEVKS